MLTLIQNITMLNIHLTNLLSMIMIHILTRVKRKEEETLVIITETNMIIIQINMIIIQIAVIIVDIEIDTMTITMIEWMLKEMNKIDREMSWTDLVMNKID